jgi:hypothetical protein
MDHAQKTSRPFSCGNRCLVNIEQPKLHRSYCGYAFPRADPTTDGSVAASSGLLNVEVIFYRNDRLTGPDRAAKKLRGILLGNDC